MVFVSLIVLGSNASAGPKEQFEEAVRVHKAGDYDAALRLWSRIAEQGDAAAQYNVGVIYYNGLGVDRNFVEALRWYRMSGEQQYSLSEFRLGDMYFWGQGMTRDAVSARRWYRRAAEQGHLSAQLKLATMYLDGLGGDRNTTKAAACTCEPQMRAMGPPRSALVQCISKAMACHKTMRWR